MARKGENIYKRKDGRWEGRYLKKLPDGTTKYGYVYAATYRDARDKLRKAAALWASNPRQGSGDALLLKNVAQRWEASIAQQVKGSTLVKYHTTVNNHILHRLQNLSPEGPRTKLVLTEPKSGSSVRLIPMPEELANMVSLLPGEHRGFFLTCREDKPCEPRVMQDTFHKHLRAAGLADANYHALRHTFATRCVELGFDVKSLSELLGHATVGMTLDRYVHPTIEHKREHMQRLSGLMPMF